MKILSWFVIRLGDLKLLVVSGDFKLLFGKTWRFEVTDSGDFKLVYVVTVLFLLVFPTMFQSFFCLFLW